MRNPLIWLGLIAIIALVILFVTNPYISTINVQLLTLMLLVPFVLGLLLGFFLGMRRGRPRPVASTTPNPQKV
jgi:peptidoglycan/LPS O-acetylase OafA/YrhL